MREYTVNEVFYSLQGEGTRAGTANFFVRFTGCNMRCDDEPGEKSPGGFKCDTEFTSGRKLTFEGLGTMFCLAGLGAEIPGMIDTAKAADLCVVLEGCPVDCAKKIFDRLGLDNYVQVKVTDIGIEKVKGASATDEQVDGFADKVKEVLAEA